MKRIALGALAILILSNAALAEETHRYFVATRRPAREVAARTISRDARDAAQRRLHAFEIVKGFAANLTASEAAALKGSADVRYVEPVVERHLLATVSKPGVQTIPYGIDQVHASEAWAGRRSIAVNVAVIDSGIDSTHPELRGAWAGGYNALDPENPDLTDEVGHGTHVAGTIAASNNSQGFVGVAPGARLWTVKAFDASGTSSMEEVMKGLEWVVNKKKEIGGRWVVNMSFGGADPADAEAEAFAAAAADGIVMVAASGNASSSNNPVEVEYPAAYPGVIAVGAVDERSVHASFSNQGPELQFVAPGMKVVSTDLSGNSFLTYAQAGDSILNARVLEGAKSGTITSDYVYCGLGAVGEFPASVANKIALIQRGGDTFADKVRHAKDAGAVAVVIFNSDGSGINWTLYPEEDPDAHNYPWPIVVAMSQVDGQALVTRGGGKLKIGYDSDDYRERSGTSMATPHVAGAFAELWALAPDATPSAMLNALITTAHDLGTPGRDDIYGYGEIDVFAAAKMLAPEAFVDSSAGSGTSTGRRSIRRGGNP